MPAIFIVAGLVILFLAVRSKGGTDGGLGPKDGQPNLPDTGVASVSMVGQTSMRVPPINSITPFAGTFKLTPDISMLRLNGANRIALKDVGTPQIPVFAPQPPMVNTRNPATSPFLASGTPSFNPGTAQTVVTAPSNIKI